MNSSTTNQPDQLQTVQNPAIEPHAEIIPGTQKLVEKTVFPILFAISFSHLLNDTIQALVPAIYPLVKESFRLSFSQIGLITLTFQLSASILQPFVGLYTDKKPQPYSLAGGMVLTLIGLVMLAYAPTYPLLLVAVAIVGVGSAIFHPEASRVAYMASGGRRGLAQSIFQVGGNAGSSLGPLLAAIIIAPRGRYTLSWFSVVAIVATAILWKIGGWYQKKVMAAKQNVVKDYTEPAQTLPRNKVIFYMTILLLLIFSKFIYLSSMTSYFTFYVIDKFDVSVQQSQMYLFIFLASVAVGTILGGPLGDRFGRKYIIWISILGAAPFTMLLPHANLFFTCVLVAIIGVIIASAFSAILVFAQELIPGKVGLVSGLFFGFAFGAAGIGSALLGKLADHTSINYVFQVCAFLPLIGIITALLPNIEGRKNTIKK